MTATLLTPFPFNAEVARYGLSAMRACGAGTSNTGPTGEQQKSEQGQRCKVAGILPKTFCLASLPIALKRARQDMRSIARWQAEALEEQREDAGK